MNLRAMVLVIFSPTMQQLADFAIFAGLFLLIGIATLIWFFYFRKTTRRIRKRRHRHRPLNPTRAQTGGLPPFRQPDNSSGDDSSPPVP